jgi:hypothetical protein
MSMTFQPSTKPNDEISYVRVNCDVFWAELTRVNKLSGKYQAILANLSDRACDELSAMGITIRSNADKPELGNYITVKSNREIKAWDEKTGDEITDKLIGNGSKATAKVTAYQWTFQGKTGTSPSLQRLGITDLVEYSSNSEEDDAQEVF